MSELTPPEPTFPDQQGRKSWPLWGTMASAMLHVAVLVLLLWQPSPNRAQAAPPQAIDVVLVPPPEAVSSSASKPPAEEPKDQPMEESKGEPKVKPKDEKPKHEPTEKTSATPPPARTAPAEPPPPKPSAAPAESAAEKSPPETPSQPAAPKSGSGATATQSSEPARGTGTSSDKVAPIPLARPPVRALDAPKSTPDGTLTTVTADTGDAAVAATPPAPSVEPDVATLELGPERSAERFYSEAMLNDPSMARARAVIEKLPPEKRLAQICSLEALAQVGNAGKGFAPDVVMAEAYAKSKTTGTRLDASGAIFRSGENWYGLAFDCTLSDDLTSVTAFSYRLGADVTDAVLARLNKT